MPEFPIVDAHVHLYDPGVIRYAWMAGKPLFEGPHRMAEFDAARGQVEVEALIWIEVDADPGQYLQEASYAAGLAEHDQRIKGIVAHAPLERGAAVTPDLEKLAAHDLCRGVRRLLQDEADAEFCLQPSFIEGASSCRASASASTSASATTSSRRRWSSPAAARRCASSSTTSASPRSATASWTPGATTSKS